MIENTEENVVTVADGIINETRSSHDSTMANYNSQSNKVERTVIDDGPIMATSYALFNPILYPEAKSNIDRWIKELNLNKGNEIAKIMAKMLKESTKADEINENTLLLALTDSGSNLNEIKYFYENIEKARRFTDKEITQYRDYFKLRCENNIINSANELKTSKERIDYIKEHEYKSQFSTKITLTSFSEAASIEEDVTNSAGFSSSVDLLNRVSPSGSYQKPALVAVAAPPGSGKSNFLMAEAIQACRAGKRVHYLAAGDLISGDFKTRMSTICNRISLSEFYSKPQHYIKEAEKVLGEKFVFSCVPSRQINSEEYLNYMKAVVDKFDVFIVDYDSNIGTTAESMYDAGGQLYDALTELSRMDGGKVVFVASQPKIFDYKNEKIGLESLAESSRKQQIVDMVVTIGSHPKSGTHCGYISVVKNRRGAKGSSPYIRSSSLQLVEISQDKYDIVGNNPMALSEAQLHVDYLSVGENMIGSGGIGGMVMAPNGLGYNIDKVIEDVLPQNNSEPMSPVEPLNPSEAFNI